MSSTGLYFLLMTGHWFSTTYAAFMTLSKCLGKAVKGAVHPLHPGYSAPSIYLGSEPVPTTPLDTCLMTSCDSNTKASIIVLFNIY